MLRLIMIAADNATTNCIYTESDNDNTDNDNNDNNDNSDNSNTYNNDTHRFHKEIAERALA